MSLLLVLVLVALAVGAGAWLVGGGHVSFGGTGAMALRPSDLSRPIAGLWAAQKASRRARRIPQRHADQLVLAACRLEPHTAADVRASIEALLAAHAVGVDPEAESRITVVGVPHLVSRMFPVQGSMTVVGADGLLVWNEGRESRGSVIYHELVHFGQFRRSEAGQRALLDSLSVADRIRPTTEKAAYDALNSVEVPLTYALPDSDRVAFRLALRGTIPEVVAQLHATPMRHLAAATDSVLARPRFAAMRERLEYMRWLHRGVPLAEPSADWDWHDELRRLMYFEAMAYSLTEGCAAATPNPRGSSRAATPSGRFAPLRAPGN
jgi:hypothetical protein